MQSLSKSDEQQLLDGVKQAVDLVDNQDMSPNDALQKVAKELGYSPGFVKAACNAFNNGRQLAQWDANDDVLDKLASFPLANYEDIHESIWGSSEEKVASVSSFMPKFASYDDEARQELLDMDLGSFEKSASAEEPHPLIADYEGELRVKKAYNELRWERRQVEEARREKVAAENRLNLGMHFLESYFKKFSYDRLPFAQVEDAAAAYYGEPGSALMSYVAAKFPSEKRASDHQSTWSGFAQVADRTQEPYTLISACIKQAQALNQTTAGFKEAEEKLAGVKEGFAPFSQPRSSSNSGSQFTLTPSLIEDAPGEKVAMPTLGNSSAAQAIRRAFGLEEHELPAPAVTGPKPLSAANGLSGTADNPLPVDLSKLPSERGLEHDNPGPVPAGFAPERGLELEKGGAALITPSLIEDAPGEKAASMLGGIAGGMGLGLSRNLVSDEEGAKKKLIEEQIGELDSPDHTNELRKIRAQTALNQLMSDPGNPISEYEPEEVMAAYNELTQLAPRLADQPSALGPLLNKRLMGNMEPFEIGESLKLEEGLQKTQPIDEGARPIESEEGLAERLESSIRSLEPRGSGKSPSPSKPKKSQTDLMKNEASIIS